MQHDPLRPYETPSSWTADHVMLRLIWAFDTLRKLRFRTGPGGYGRGWPAYVHEYKDLLAQEEAETADARRRKYERRDVYLPPSQLDVSMMEEAFGWPLAHLTWTPGFDTRNPVEIVAWAWRRSTNQDAGGHGTIDLVEAEARRIARALHRLRVPVR